MRAAPRMCDPYKQRVKKDISKTHDPTMQPSCQNELRSWGYGGKAEWPSACRVGSGANGRQRASGLQLGPFRPVSNVSLFFVSELVPSFIRTVAGGSHDTFLFRLRHRCG